MDPYKTSENGVPVAPKEKKRKGGFFLGMFLGIVLTLLAVVIIGGAVSLVSMAIRYSGRSTADSVINDASLKKVEKIESLINDYYYKDEDIDVAKMEDGMYSGIVESLGDKYSEYYDREQLKEILESTEGVFYGIGAYLVLDEASNCAMITGTIADTPAEAAGLRNGDLVYKINDESAQGLSLDEVVAKIRGEAGTTVHLTIFREGEPDYLEFDIVRQKVESPTVTYKMLEDGIGYIQITEFDDVTTDQFTDAYATIKGNNAKGLILDLRSNPGGNVSTVVDIGRQLLPKGNIVYTENKKGEREEYKCDGKHEIQIPMVVLIDGYSASASEILAGAIKDYEKGVLVGTTTFGKGIVQRIISLSDGTALKITESSYYSPKGINIHGVGIEPDVEVEFNSDAYYDEGIDNQLEKAKEVLLEMME